MSTARLSRTAAAVFGVLLAASAHAQVAPAPQAPGGAAIRIGVGGEFPEGFQGMIARLGLPVERIWLHQLSDPAVLRHYDIVFASDCIPGDSRFVPALKEYVSGGGKAVLEMWRSPQSGLLPGDLVAAEGPINLQFPDPSHPIARGFKPGAAVESSETTEYGLVINNPTNVTVLARYSATGPVQGVGGSPLLRDGGLPAIVSIKMGTGELVFCGSPVGFPVGWRSPQLEPLAVNLIEYLLAGRAEPRFLPDLDREPRPIDGISVHTPPAPAETVVRRPDAAPDGFVAADAPGSPDFDVRGTLVAEALPPDQTLPVLLLDCVAAGQYTALGFDHDRLAIWTEAAGRRKPLWRSTNAPSAGRADLIVKRRPDGLAVALDGRLCAEVKRPTDVVGAVFFRDAKGVPHLEDAWCQDVARPYFSDDFMREAGENTGWKTLTGQWQQLGIDNPEQSVNGFTYVATAETEATSSAGDWFWDDYTLSVAVRPLTETASAGLCFERLANGDYAVFKVDNRATAGAAAHLVRVTPQGSRELAAAPAGCETGQWSRLAVRLQAGRIEAYVDGRKVLEAADDSPACGAIGLYAATGKVAFDDVQLVPSEEATEDSIRTFRSEGTPQALMPINVGPTDYMSWASRAIGWNAESSRPSLLWHKGLYLGDVSLRLALPAPSPRVFEATLILSRGHGLNDAQTVHIALPANAQSALLGLPEAKGKELSVPVAEGGKPVVVSLSRSQGLLCVDAGGKRLLSAKAEPGALVAGINLIGAPIPISSLRVEAPDIRDYTFAAAPTDWRSSSGDWQVLSRWACDPRWSWYTGSSEGIAAVWNKHRFAGDICLDFWIAVKHKGPGGDETERQRDLNCVIFGDGDDPRTGYSFILGGTGGVVTSLVRNGQVVAQNPEIHIPEAYAVHHQWFHVQARKVGHTVSLTFEDRPALQYDDPNPIDAGFVGLWTRRSAICLSRVTIYYEKQDPLIMLGG